MNLISYYSNNVSGETVNKNGKTHSLLSVNEFVLLHQKQTYFNRTEQ